MRVTALNFISVNVSIVKTLFILLLTIPSLHGFSQINKGQWLIGGNGAFSYYKYYSTKTSAISLSPASGYFFLNRLGGGLRLGYDVKYNSFPVGRRSRESFLSITPFVRYYFLSYEHKFNIFVDGGFGYSWGKYKDFTPPDFNYRSKVISFKTGPAIFLNERTALEITLGYNHAISGGLGDTLAVNVYQIGIGLQVHIGKQKD